MRVWKGFSVVLVLDFSRCLAQLSAIPRALREEGWLRSEELEGGRRGGFRAAAGGGTEDLACGISTLPRAPSTPLIVPLEVEFGCIELHV